MTFIFILFVSIQLLLSCSCVGSSFCQSIEGLTDEETDLVFMGSFIKSEDIDGIFTAMQFNVIKVYHGEIITPSSVHYTGEEYKNTASTVWIISGNSSICMPDIDNQSAIFGLSYNSHNAIGGPPNELGYAPQSCTINYFPIAADDTVTGWIWNFNEIDTVTIEEFEEVIYDKCGINTIATSTSRLDYYSENTVIYPQPTTGELEISNSENFVDWELRLVELSGREVAKLNFNSIDVSEYAPGVYFLEFVKDRQRFIKKIVKI